jgi:hypothetical protein
MYTTKYFPNLYTITEIKKRNESVVDFFPMIPQREHLTCHAVHHCQRIVGHIMDLLCPTFFTVYVETNNNIISSVKSVNI